MTSPVMAVKTLSVKHWEHTCGKCGSDFDVEEDAARMAPMCRCTWPRQSSRSPSSTEEGCYLSALRPHGDRESRQGQEQEGRTYPARAPAVARGCAQAGREWPAVRRLGAGRRGRDRALEPGARCKIRLLEVRGALPDEVTCPETKVTFATESGTVPKKSHYACGACGTVQDVLTQ